MSFEWINITLGNFLNLKRGYDLPKTKRKDGDIPIISSSGYSGVHDISMAKGPGVVTGRYGTIGEVFYIPENFWPLNTTLYVEDFKGNSPLFSYYLLQTIDFHAYSDKAAVPGINRNHVHMASIRVPNSIIAQEKIASILKKLEDKITSNKKINHTLEQIAQALFKSWFVDFEPVKAKIVVLEAGGSPEDATLATMAAISGKDIGALVVFEREHPEQYAELKSTAELFPSAMQESKLGMIPNGWCIDSIYEISNVIYGAPFKSKEFHSNKDEGLPLVRIRDLKNESPGVRTNEIHPKGYMLNDGDLIVGMDGEFKPYVWGGGNAWMNQRVCLFKPKKSIDEFFIFNSITPHLKYLEATATATTVIHLGKGDIDRFTFTNPGESLLSKYSKFSRNIRELLVNNKRENRLLTQLRDTLLPKLLSGEITLPEAEQAVSEVENV
ncbi:MULTISPECIES: restriction endonuclease subunit S [Serratia]|uniref:restriction endonuclease subunit S n=1 Tax=Serratia TaxID=613 RepID=UPI0008A8755A|nr:restriction endonuclease subunit S [Serratia marcescens]APS36938.1 hypothetical protein RN42_25240 [Serratia marcescens]OHT35103.1 hypothetical protein BGV45_11685 [Serratia marcescens]OHT36319.1 hypothetical protein BGV46_11675 [Serratia marcescens]